MRCKEGCICPEEMVPDRRVRAGVQAVDLVRVAVAADKAARGLPEAAVDAGRAEEVRAAAVRVVERTGVLVPEDKIRTTKVRRDVKCRQVIGQVPGDRVPEPDAG